jgi:aspartate/methionine/tyrosine aminotransferase
MNVPGSENERNAAEALLVEAIRLHEVELEPTADEIESFLAEDARSDEPEAVPSPETAAAYAAMNRANREDKFAEGTQQRLEARRKLLLEELIRRHADTDE